MPASNVYKGNILNSLIRGLAFPIPSQVWVSLHTADPAGSGAGEVTTAAWPSYVRRDSIDVAARTDAWAAPDGDYITWNQLQLIWPVFDGGSDITLTHFGLWSAESGGTFLTYGALDTPRIIGPDQVYVADIGKLGVKVT